MRHFVFRVGPIKSAMLRTSAYFAYPGTEAHRVSFAQDDVTALRELSRWLAGEVIICEPQLEEAAQQLDLTCESYTPERVNALDMIAFDLALPGRLSSVEPQELIYAYGASCAEYYRATPWNAAFANRVIGALIMNHVNCRIEARILGLAGKQHGLALFEVETYRALSLKTDREDAVDALLHLDILGVAFANEPHFAVDAMLRAHGLNMFPVPVKLSSGQTLPLDSRDVLTLCAMLRAISALRDSTEPSYAEVQVGDLHVTAIAWVV
jgi:hypothetical protein